MVFPKKSLTAASICFAIILGALIGEGCDENSIAAGNYNQPTPMGTGTIISFDACNSYGTNVFHPALIQFITTHPGWRLVSIIEADHSGNSAPSKYLVVFSLDNGASPPPQPTPPDLSQLKVESQ